MPLIFICGYALFPSAILLYQLIAIKIYYIFVLAAKKIQKNSCNMKLLLLLIISLSFHKSINTEPMKSI